MIRINVQRVVAAPPEAVFRALADVEHLPETSPEIVGVEFLSETRMGTGTRFRETRLARGKPMVTELEVTDYEQDRRIRFVTDSHGTVWDTIFHVEPAGAGTVLTLVMTAKAHALLPRVINPIVQGLYRRGIERHLDAVKAYCERPER